MIEIFNENGCPPLRTGCEVMQGGDYKSFLSILEWLKVPNTEIALLNIDNIEKGVTDWQRFGRVLKEKFPNLKAIVVEIGEYKNDDETDLCEAAERFFVEMQLDFLEITCKQFTEEDFQDKSTEHYKISVYTEYSPPPEPPHLCCVCEKECPEDDEYCEGCIEMIEALPYKMTWGKNCLHRVVACCQYGTQWDKDCVEVPENCVLCDRDIHPSEYYDALRENDDYHVALQTLLGIDPNAIFGDNEYDYVYCTWCI